MKNKLSCDIVMDLLPSYVEGLTRENTNKEVKEHLEECESCLKSYITMQTPAKRVALEEEKEEIDFLKVTKKKHQKKLMVAVGTTIAICILLVVGNNYLGNPINHLLATNAAEKYVEETYGDKDYYVDRVGYDKGGHYPYYATIKSKTSEDTVFSVFISSMGEVGGDNYEYVIEERYTVLRRITKEYANLVNEVFAKEDFPVESIVLQGTEVCGGRIQTTSRAQGEYRPNYGIVMQELELDKEYDIMKLGKAAGTIYIDVHSEEITAEKAAEYILQIKEFFDKEGVPFYAIDFKLSEPLQEGRTAEYICVTGFLYDDIYEEGLAERVQAAHDAERAYWEGQ